MDPEKAVKIAKRFGIDVEAIMRGEIRRLLQKYVDAGTVRVLDQGAGKFEILVNVADADASALGKIYVAGKFGELVKEFVKVKTDGTKTDETAAP